MWDFLQNTNSEKLHVVYNKSSLIFVFEIDFITQTMTGKNQVIGADLSSKMKEIEKEIMVRYRTESGQSAYIRIQFLFNISSFSSAYQ